MEPSLSVCVSVWHSVRYYCYGCTVLAGCPTPESLDIPTRKNDDNGCGVWTTILIAHASGTRESNTGAIVVVTNLYIYYRMFGNMQTGGSCILFIYKPVYKNLFVVLIAYYVDSFYL